MRWSFWIELRGPARLWAASITFTILGAVIALVLPGLFSAANQDPLASIAMGILGWTLSVLGLVVLLPMVATLYIRRTQPEQEAVWHWWVNFIGGLLGALAFAVPATLALPIFIAAYLVRPNALFPSDSTDTTKNLGIAALFSVVGIVSLLATIFLAREKLKQETKREN